MSEFNKLNAEERRQALHDLLSSMHNTGAAIERLLDEDNDQGGDLVEKFAANYPFTQEWTDHYSSYLTLRDGWSEEDLRAQAEAQWQHEGARVAAEIRQVAEANGIDVVIAANEYRIDEPWEDALWDKYIAPHLAVTE